MSMRFDVCFTDITFYCRNWICAIMPIFMIFALNQQTKNRLRSAIIVDIFVYHMFTANIRIYGLY